MRRKDGPSASTVRQFQGIGESRRDGPTPAGFGLGLETLPLRRLRQERLAAEITGDCPSNADVRCQVLWAENSVDRLFRATRCCSSRSAPPWDNCCAREEFDDRGSLERVDRYGAEPRIARTVSGGSVRQFDGRRPLGARCSRSRQPDAALPRLRTSDGTATPTCLSSASMSVRRVAGLAGCHSDCGRACAPVA
jgi:hypothetical protein